MKFQIKNQKYILPLFQHGLAAFQMKIHGEEIKIGGDITKAGDKLCHNFALGLWTLPNLRCVELDGVRLSESFFAGMATGAPYSQVPADQVLFVLPSIGS